MTSNDIANILKHEILYFSWAGGEGYPHEPVDFAIALAAQLRLPVIVVSRALGNIPDTLSKADYITERSSRSSERRSVVLLHYPTAPLMDKIPFRSAAHIVAAEYPTNPLLTWAAKREAWDLRSEETMALNLSPETKKLYDRILWNGNNGWRDAPGKRDARRDLNELRDRGVLDKEQLLGYLVGEKSSRTLEHLASLIDKTLAG